MEEPRSTTFAGADGSDHPAESISAEQTVSAAVDLDDEPALIVEERLLICRASLACLRHVACLAERESDVPFLSSRERFARVTRQFIRGLESQLEAIRRALPVSATNLRAPAAAARASDEESATTPPHCASKP